MTADRIHTIAIIGAGAWGTALARLIAHQGYAVRLWAYEPDVAHTINASRENSFYLKGVSLPSSLYATSRLDEAVHGAQALILASPSHVFHTLLLQLAPSLPSPMPIVIATKGIEDESLRLMSDVVDALLPSYWHSWLLVLSGPSFAAEVSQDKPTTVLLAGRNAQLVEQLQQLLMTPTFRIYGGTDLIGAQIGGALKNVMAIASGIVDGLQLGFNARAALITRGLAEMIRLGSAMGAHVATLYGLSGLGDLVLTCTGPLSRNYTVGFQLGCGASLDRILAETHTVAEGIRTTRAAVGLARRYGIDMPIVQSVYDVLFNGRNPRDAVSQLMTRAARSELDPVLARPSADH
ncbi:MAG: NAD(P)-dependent glycerol-3-phosphate dehydrogenase [Nitrospirae bacterium]|nr:MAG: NAD(P)-dependent glycerol-3-phosphate dehydrogenase [Nitrospirota bacterium]